MVTDNGCQNRENVIYPKFGSVTDVRFLMHQSFVSPAP